MICAMRFSVACVSSIVRKPIGKTKSQRSGFVISFKKIKCIGFANLIRSYVSFSYFALTIIDDEAKVI